MFDQELIPIVSNSLGQAHQVTRLDAILKLCAKMPVFIKAYAYPETYRTSNMIDLKLAGISNHRLINSMALSIVTIG